MEEQKIITPEYEDIKEEYEIKINNNKLKIEINNDEIIFLLIKGLTYFKYIKRYKYEEIIKELNILENNDIKSVYNYLIKSEYKIKDKKIIINNKNEIELKEKTLTNEEMIKILIEEIKEIKEKSNKEKERINELIKMNENKENEIKILENKYNELKEIINELDENKKDKYKDKISLIYEIEKEGMYNIFGEKFVENNKNNIELNINGNKSEIVNKYKLKKGNNEIKMIIKNKITNLEYMFYECNKLKNINELKYFNTKFCNNFSFMFYGCSLLSDIKGLEKWNVSKGNNFTDMFYQCSSLSDYQSIRKMECFKS